MNVLVKMQWGLAILCTVTGGAGSFYLAQRGAWQDLGQPPEMPNSIWMVSTDAVHVKTADGHVYTSRRVSLPSPLCWSAERRWTEGLPPLAGWEVGECTNELQDKAGLPPQPVTDSRDCLLTWGGGEGRVAYALLDSGHVWRKEYPGEFARAFSMPCLGWLGAVLGASLGVVLAKLINRFTTRTVWAV